VLARRPAGVTSSASCDTSGSPDKSIFLDLARSGSRAFNPIMVMSAMTAGIKTLLRDRCSEEGMETLQGINRIQSQLIFPPRRFGEDWRLSSD
jgi:hypothetical protein